MTNLSLALDKQIVSDPGIHQGEPIVAGRLTPLRAIAELWTKGLAAQEIPLHLPHLQLHQVFAALHYYLTQRQENDPYIAGNHIPEEWAGRRFDPATGQVR